MRVIFAIALFPLLTPAPASPQDSIPDSTTRASSRSLAGVLLGRLPVDEPRHALPLIAGVVLRTSSIGIDTRPVLLIRGGRRGAMNVYVDGAPLRFQTLGSAGIGPAFNALEEAMVITGVAAPALWDVGGGALVYTTRTAGARWGGDVRWDSDEPFGNAYTVGYNRIEGSAGGPIGVRTTVFASATLQGQRSAYRGPSAASVPTYVPAGLDTTVTDGFGGQTALPLFAQWSGECDAAANGGVECQGLRRPFDWSSARRIQAKVEHRYGGGRLSVTGLGGELQHRFFPGQSAINPALYEGRRAWSAAAIVNWRHELGALRGAPLALDVNLSVVGHRDISGPLDPDAETATRDPYLGITFERLRFLGADLMGFPVGASLLRDVRTNSGTRGVPFFGSPNDRFQAHRGNPYGLSTGAEWWTGGSDGMLTYVNERRVQGRVALVWRPAMHSLTLGLDAERSRIASYSTGSLSRQIDLDVFAARPGRLGFFTGDRFVVGSTLIDLGLRYDRFNAGGDFPQTPLYISSSGPALWNPSSASDDTAYANSVARVFHRARSQGVLSPRLRVSHPLSRKLDLRIGYGRVAEPPSWQTYFARTNADLSFTNTNRSVGRDVDFVVTSTIEAGVRASFGFRTDLDVALYRKDDPDYVNRLVGFPDPRDPTRITFINVLTTSEGPHTEGIELQLQRRGGWLESAAAYSLARTRTEQPGALPADGVVSHAVTVAATLRGPEQSVAAGVEVVAVLRTQSGEPYTRLQNVGAGTVTPLREGQLPAEAFNGSQTPWTTRLDLRVTKAVRVAGRNWSIYVDARNVLNARNLIALFAETGGTVNAIHRQVTIGDPSFPSGEYSSLRFEAQDAGALEPDGTTVNLTACSVWGNPVNCVALTRVERRFGDGNGLYTLAEQERAFNAYYEDFFGAWRFSAPGRTLRVGISLGL
jgi:hypothetical protein